MSEAGWRPGEVVTDLARRTAGVVHSVAEDGTVRLVRPGGPAWWAESGDLRAATRAEVISVKVATANHRWGR
ncbi:hypothetical protein [Streptomyces reniochalinae]|uniref:Uncharacterized protein n=1 Tax=Streptomyces reniochalinae TaxID=2250578 RepID=A0A367EB14_9ACTN|nr:hypothetical protein [Streptomyces reniochalinae]RCG15258.1 hypothetical protein DQ392_23990 [Streptomyces reniochalinae]